MINVVAAIITNEKGQILIAQRNLRKSQGGLWEFPGGKIEPNEIQEQAIIREIKEELNMDIKCESYFDEQIHKYPDKTIKLIALNCTMINNNYQLNEHEAIAWVYPYELEKYKFAPADLPIVRKLNNTN